MVNLGIIAEWDGLGARRWGDVVERYSAGTVLMYTSLCVSPVCEVNCDEGMVGLGGVDMVSWVLRGIECPITGLSAYVVEYAVPVPMLDGLN